MFLTPRRDMKRKMSEIYISLLMEAEFTKEEIFSLYVNKIFLGQRAYGVGAAAEVYFGKTLDQLTVAEMATLAGIPTAPSVVNPVANAEAAKDRGARTCSGGCWSSTTSPRPSTTRRKIARWSRGCTAPRSRSEAPYVAEMVRNEMQAKYGDGVYTAGYKVYTTIDSRLQAAATVALRTGLLEYDRRHGYRGATAKVDLSKLADAQGSGRPARGLSRDRRPAAGHRAESRGEEREDLREGHRRGDPALGEAVLGETRIARGKGRPRADVGRRDPDPGRCDLHRGTDGRFPAVRAGAGGAERSGGGGSARRRGRRAGRRLRLFSEQIQSGDAGAGGNQARVSSPSCTPPPSTRVIRPRAWFLDAPMVIDETGTEQAWRPKEYEGNFAGPMRLREAMVHSRNLVSVRLMRAIGGDYTWNYVHSVRIRQVAIAGRFDLGAGHRGIESAAGGRSGIPRSPTADSRSAPTTSTGLRTRAGKVLLQADPAVACPECGRATDPRRRSQRRAPATCAQLALDEAPHDGKTMIPEKNLAPQIIRPQIAYLLADMMADVIRSGTGSARPIPQSRRYRRQDRHHQRCARYVVQRLQRRFDDDGVGGFRSGSLAGRRRAGRPYGHAGLDLLHARGAGGRPETWSSRAGRHRRPRAFRPKRACSRAPTIPTASWRNSSRAICPSPKLYEGPDKNPITMATNRYSRPHR